MSDGWSSSEDEWEDSSFKVPKQAQTITVAPWDTLSTYEYTRKDHKYYHGLKSTLKLENFGITSDGQKIIHRCEPLKDPRSGEKNYPTVTTDVGMLSYPRVLLNMALFHPNCGHVHVRFPDLKDKVDQHRSQRGIWVNPNDGPFRMKKKATDKTTKEDVAFRLGADYKFHTPGIEPCFVIVATPFDGSKFLFDKAIRSEHFIVRSKRQEQPGPRKRRKKAKELDKLETDIDAARNEKELLQREDARLHYMNTKHQNFLRNIGNNIKDIPEDSTVGIALRHAVRPIAYHDTSVTL
jgi:hypothetical protein